MYCESCERTNDPGDVNFSHESNWYIGRCGCGAWNDISKAEYESGLSKTGMSDDELKRRGVDA